MEYIASLSPKRRWNRLIAGYAGLGRPSAAMISSLIVGISTSSRKADRAGPIDYCLSLATRSGTPWSFRYRKKRYTSVVSSRVSGKKMDGFYHMKVRQSKIQNNTSRTRRNCDASSQKLPKYHTSKLNKTTSMTHLSRCLLSEDAR